MVCASLYIHMHIHTAKSILIPLPTTPLSIQRIGAVESYSRTFPLCTTHSTGASSPSARSTRLPISSRTVFRCGVHCLRLVLFHDGGFFNSAVQLGTPYHIRSDFIGFSDDSRMALRVLLIVVWPFMLLSMFVFLSFLPPRECITNTIQSTMAVRLTVVNEPGSLVGS